MRTPVAIPSGAGKRGTAHGRPGASPRAKGVLLVTPDQTLRDAITEELTASRWQVRHCSGGAQAVALLEDWDAATAIILGDWLPDLAVDECLEELAWMRPGIPVLGTDGRALRAWSGSGNRPDQAELSHVIRRAGERLDVQPGTGDVSAIRHDNSQAAIYPMPAVTSAEILPVVPVRSASSDAALPEFLGADPRQEEVVRRIRLVARRKTTVLVQGPTGTGKELVARALHRLSPRSAQPFIVVNCAAIPEALLEAELFGHVRGAFTGAIQARKGRIEAASGGTLFLDEIGELPQTLQAKLLRFLEAGEIQRVGENEPIVVDVRVIAATHRQLAAMSAAGTFRADLFFRLSVFPIETPALAGRVADIDTLVSETLRRLAVEDGRMRGISEDAMELLRAHPWPGNVRELQHTVERAWILAGDAALIDSSCIEFGLGFSGV